MHHIKVKNRVFFFNYLERWNRDGFAWLPYGQTDEVEEKKIVFGVGPQRLVDVIDYVHVLICTCSAVLSAEGGSVTRYIHLAYNRKEEQLLWKVLNPPTQRFRSSEMFNLKMRQQNTLGHNQRSSLSPHGSTTTIRQHHNGNRRRCIVTHLREEFTNNIEDRYF